MLPRSPPPPPRPDVPAARLHLWQFQAVRDVIVVLAVIGLVALGYRLSLVTVPLLLGLLLAYLLEPAIRRIAAWTNRAVAAALVVCAFLALVVLPLTVGAAFAFVQAIEQSHRIEENWPRVVERVERYFDEMGIPIEPPQPETEARPQASSRPETAGDAEGTAPPSNVDTALRQLFPARILGLPVPLFLRERLAHLHAGELTANARGVLLGIWKGVLGTGMFLFKYVFLTAVFFFFCSVALERLSRKGPSLVPIANRSQVVEIVRKMNRAIAAFVRGRLVIALILGVLHAIGYWLVGVPAPILFGVAVGILTIVPYLSIIGWIASMIAFAITQAGAADPHPWWWILLGPTIVYVVLQPVDDYLLTPRIQGQQTGLSTPVVLFAVIGGGVLAGVYGILISIPIAACIKIFVTEVLWPPYRDWVEGRAADPLPLEDPPSPENGA